jgi:hypothetical protein
MSRLVLLDAATAVRANMPSLPGNVASMAMLAPFCWELDCCSCSKGARMGMHSQQHMAWVAASSQQRVLVGVVFPMSQQLQVLGVLLWCHVPGPLSAAQLCRVWVTCSSSSSAVDGMAVPSSTSFNSNSIPSLLVL